MPVTHLLDTSVYSQPISKQPHVEVMKRWQTLGDTALVTSIICEAEVLFGICKKSSTKLTAQYASILKGRFDALPVDSSVAAIYAELRAECEKNGKKLGDMDLLIAANRPASTWTAVAERERRHRFGVG